MTELWDFLSPDVELGDFETDYEKADYLQNMLVSRATNGGYSSNEHYQVLRRYFLDKPNTRSMVPTWVRTTRDLNQFWQFIKHEFSTYAERREFIWREFSPLLDYLEQEPNSPHTQEVSDNLFSFDSEHVVCTWQKALERKHSDPEGAITMARTLMESVLKHILDDAEISYGGNPDIHELYKIVAKRLNLAPEQHSEGIFRQILGGCSGIVSGLGSLRNNFGDAHGRGRKSYVPSTRHAELAVNLAGTVCLFLVQTYQYNLEDR